MVIFNKRVKPIKLKEYFKSSYEIVDRFKSLPQIKNPRTEVEDNFKKNGISPIKYFPNLKIRQEKIHKRYFEDNLPIGYKQVNPSPLPADKDLK